MSYSNSNTQQQSNTVSVYNTRTENPSKTKLIRLVNGHYRRVVDISNRDEKEILFRTCTCAFPTPRNKDIRNPYIPPPNNVETIAYRKRIYSSFMDKECSDIQKNESTTESEDTIEDYSETASIQESTIDDETEPLISSNETEDDKFYGLFDEVEDEKREDLIEEKEEDFVEENEESLIEEKEESLIEEKEESLIEEKEESLVEEKEESLVEEKKEVPPENKTLILPSKTLMKGIKTNIYFLSNKEKIQVILCYNYKCDAVAFEKGTYLRYLYIKSINNIILNERMIAELCKNENLKYILACNSIVVESSDFIKPLIIEFESSTSKNIFVKHIKHNSKKEMDINKFDEYMRDLKSNEKIRLQKVERFHSINLAYKQ
ncbi:conserved Plasmodium protein, unknown function [Plasmodium chabaudi chabaudi]|uniref:Uncharacterized protein n=1 Tax=Plasmodium chabaudi chabaudi TaxID=31271 RepID=A0A077THU5_PLACU|nr:conserved Plasmodium protein, unknown function [Plasmodium chabaudi chabaudi]SCM19667.1 conserved Plasmodium protein, unknown function [Plasmodium chabaudi chabaudi]VTZ67673.1 conserved Plasmodium protein, unknown function [Plasmodium chabaudi chabaudi]|eukprot:XP_016653412.1 conserved Plasmodium protein, unknown function [Plasmodium chabaudi chabaudi]